MIAQRSCAQTNTRIWDPAKNIMETYSKWLLINSGEGAAKPAENGNNGLNEAAKEGHEYVRERLSQELGREPTKEEIDEWLRQHTESY